MSRRPPRRLTARLVAAALAAGLVIGGTAQLANASPAEAVTASKAAKKKAKKRCGKGKKLVTVKVKRNGKKVNVKKCKKRKAPKGGGDIGGGGTGGGTGGGPASLFEPPGSRLEGEAAKPFLQRYLLNSRFTDCPAGWPNCVVEQRYSHFADTSFYYCRLTSTSGADIRAGSSYTVQNAVVEADGSWTFNEIVPSGDSPSFYEWHVSTAGVVTGVYQFPGNAPQQLGPLQYVPGALDCSY